MHRWDKNELDKRYGQYKQGKMGLHDWREVHNELRTRHSSFNSKLGIQNLYPASPVTPGDGTGVAPEDGIGVKFTIVTVKRI